MLTEKHINDFKRDGFVIVRQLYSADEIEKISKWSDEVSDYLEIPGKYMMYFEESQLISGKRILSRIEDIEPYHENLSKLFTDDRMLGSVSQLFGEEAILFKDKINFKMPGADGFKAHQDIQAGWDSYASLHITAMVSIDSSTRENGYLELAAGYHDQGIIGEKWKPLDENALDYIGVQTESGDAVFFNSYAPHRSGPNHTQSARRVLYVTYNKLSDGDHRRQYYDDKRKSYPPDCEREEGKEYVFRV